MPGNPFLDRLDMHRIGHAGRKSEQRVIKAMGARPMPASGAKQGAKGDASLGQFRLEMKSTQGRTLAVDASWLAKITDEAMRNGQRPALVMSFVKPDGSLQSIANPDWVAIPRWVFEELIGEAE